MAAVEPWILAPGVTLAPTAVTFSYARSGGPGGQNVNKLNTKAELRFRITALVGLTPGASGRLTQLLLPRYTAQGDYLITAETHRTQEANRKACIEKLTHLVRAAVVEPKKRRPTKPSKASKLRRLDGKKRDQEIKAQRRVTWD
ncbi:MAG: alternative ribosome rescue aminoacyl-tRNA hydrolase ArfB [Phycisphaerae bacterium]